MAEETFTISISGMTQTLLDQIDAAAEKVNRTRSNFIIETMREIVEATKKSKSGRQLEK